MKIILLITTLALVESRPQKSQGNEGPTSVEIEKHEVIQLHPIATNREILTKQSKELDDVTQEILRKIDSINQKYGYTTTRSPSRSTNVNIPHFYEHSYDRPLPIRLANFLQKKLEEQFTKEDKGRRNKQINFENETDVDGQENVENQTDGVKEVNIEKQLDVHKHIELEKQRYLEKQINVDRQMNVEKHNFIQSQMLNNVKGIILKSQLPPYIQGLSNFNPLVQNLPFLNSFIPYRKSENYESSGYINNVPNMPFNEYKVDGYRPDKDIPKTTKPIENGNIGIFNYLRILFDMEKYANRNVSERTGKHTKQHVDISQYDEEPVQSTLQNMDIIENEEYKQSESSIKHISKNPHSSEQERIDKALKKKQKTNDDQKTLNPLQLLQNKFKQSTTTTTTQQTPLDDADVKDIINEHNKKVLSRDNTGSGIFIHRIKVKKGGVAIAGPGGIATAGSGGTAIVGPNGYAYTHPDSLAIAGSGSKVIAVEPNVSLADIINGNHKGRRVGKVVAIGPVIYYNKG